MAAQAPSPTAAAHGCGAKPTQRPPAGSASVISSWLCPADTRSTLPDSVGAAPPPGSSPPVGSVPVAIRTAVALHSTSTGSPKIMNADSGFTVAPPR